MKITDGKSSIRIRKPLHGSKDPDPSQISQIRNTAARKKPRLLTAKIVGPLVPEGGLMVGEGGSGGGSQHQTLPRQVQTAQWLNIGSLVLKGLPGADLQFNIRKKEIPWLAL